VPEAEPAKTLLTLKEATPMSRPPFVATPASASRPLTPSKREAERRTLVVGKGISIEGIVREAERLVVEGVVEATLIHAVELVVAPGGLFKGEVEVEDADISGVVDGVLVARGSLIVRASGKLVGTAHCRRLQVEDGGQITGRLEMITEPRDAVKTGDDPAF
jgi:cytoskeletal protein CcmA (bactofilin family)